MQKSPLSRLIFPILFFLLPVVYFLLFGWRGFCDTDQGFILGISWRLGLGQVPYTDFIYVRPLFSPWLHSLFLNLFPENLQLIGSRLLFYLFLWGSVLLCTQTIKRFFDLEKWGISPWLFACLAFVLSVHNFPPMAWHTIDGILLGSLGLFLLSRKPHIGWGIAGMIALFLAAACKQSFYPMPIVGIVVLIWLYPIKKAVIAALSGVGISLSIGWMSFGGGEQIGKFLAQSTGTASAKDLLQAGFIKYLKPMIGISLPLVLGAFGVKWLSAKGKLPGFIDNGYKKGVFGILFWCGIVALIGLTALKSVLQGAYLPPQYGYPQALFGIALVPLGMGLFARAQPESEGEEPVLPRKAKYGVLLTLLGLAWCSGISWGYSWPVLVFVPILVGVMAFAQETLNFTPPKWLFPTLLAMLFLLNVNLGRHAYHDQGPHEHHLGEVFPKATGVYTGQVNFQKHQELKQLIERYGDGFSVLPAMPLAHFLNGSTPQLPVDWAHNAEANWAQNADWMIESINTGPNVVFIEKDKLHEAETEGKYGSSITAYVLENWNLVEDEKYFSIYQR